MADEATWTDRIELRGRRYLELARLIEPHATRLLQDQKKLNLGIKDISYRFKLIERIIEKVIDKKKSGKNYDADMLPDILGYRIVSYHLSDIASLIGNIFNNSICHSLFLPNSEIEITVNSNFESDSPLSNFESIKETIQNHPNHSYFSKVEIKPDTRKTGYSSVHVVGTWIPPKTDEALKFLKNPDNPKSMLIEIQLRNCIEDVWGSYDHTYYYNTQRGKTSDEFQHLRILKLMLDGVNQFMEFIKRDLPKAAIVETESSKHRRPIDSPDRHKEVFTQRFPRLAADYEKACALWNDFEARRKNGDLNLLEETANAFYTLEFNEEITRHKSTPPLDRIYYSLRAERAYIFSYSRDQNHLDAAQGIYETLIKEDTDDWVSRYRLGSLLQRRGNNPDEALKQLTEAEQLFKRLSSEKRTGIGWVAGSISQIQAIVHWQIANKVRDRLDEYDHHLQAARKLAQSVVDASGADHVEFGPLNDLIFYLAEVGLSLTARGESKTAQFNEICDQLRAYLPKLRNALERGRKSSTYQLADTLLRASVLIGEPSDIKAHAVELLEILCKIATDAALERGDLAANAQPLGRHRAAAYLNADQLDSHAFALEQLDQIHLAR